MFHVSSCEFQDQCAIHCERSETAGGEKNSDGCKPPDMTTVYSNAMIMSGDSGSGTNFLSEN